MAKANGKLYSEVWALKTPHPSLLSLQEVYFSLYIAKTQLHLGIMTATGNMYVRKSKRMLALEPDLTLISPKRKKTAQQIVFAQGSAPKYQVIPTQMGLVKRRKTPVRRQQLAGSLLPRSVICPAKFAVIAKYVSERVSSIMLVTTLTC